MNDEIYEKHQRLRNELQEIAELTARDDTIHEGVVEAYIDGGMDGAILLARRLLRDYFPPVNEEQTYYK